MNIGDDSHRYEVINGWGDLPPGLEFGTTHGVVEDADGRIYIHNTGAKTVIVFDPNGAYLNAWGEQYSLGAHGMHLQAENGREFLYLAVTKQNFVVKTSLDGDEVYRIETPDRPDIYDDDKPFVPTECAVASNGDLYVADGYGQPWVHHYTGDAEYVRSFGGLGDGPGELDNPHGIMIDTRGDQELVLVSDRRNRRLQYFTLDGEHLRFVDHDLRLPCTTIQLQDEIYVPDLHSRLSVFDKDDQLITHLGDWPDCWEREDWPNLPKDEWLPDKFSSPHDMHVDAAGNIYVAEWLPGIGGKVTKLVRA